MKAANLSLHILCWLLTFSVQAQLPASPASQLPLRQLPLRQSPLWQLPLRGYFLTDSIEIGRPFRYSLTYRHSPTADILFPDTARHFAPYYVQKVVVFATQTTGAGPTAVSRDSAVYTLVSFQTDSIQLVQVPVRIINARDCTALWTLPDTVFLRSKLRMGPVNSRSSQSLTLATETELAPLQQQFNYIALGVGVTVASLVLSVLYWLFGQAIRRQWHLYLLNRRHTQFLRMFSRLSNRISSVVAAEVANQAVVMWKTYLEQLDPQPYISLTTPELAERMNDEQVTNALRETDQMIYGGSFTPQSQTALRVLSDVATQMFLRCRDKIRHSGSQKAENLSTNPAESSSFS